jgi:hypothetical protein
VVLKAAFNVLALFHDGGAKVFISWGDNKLFGFA